MVLLESDGGWLNVYVGKNRRGHGQRNIGEVHYTSAQVSDVSAAVVDELTADGSVNNGPKERGPSRNAQMLHEVIQAAMLVSTERFQPECYNHEVKFVTIDAVHEEFYAKKDGRKTPTQRRSTGQLSTGL